MQGKAPHNRAVRCPLSSLYEQLVQLMITSAQYSVYTFAFIFSTDMVLVPLDDINVMRQHSKEQVIGDFAGWTTIEKMSAFE
ncbi:hypothetical protein PNH38_11205 [Anoxybacillus rupiensis]|uniref:Uncharacterized protein n=1 Tax=Anoxybacteroides rupiense TaxID=311460 RepID=A0ABT5W541_9BACL|nr:hypothetical protein [Anoxybacillus rupiensis]